MNAQSEGQLDVCGERGQGDRGRLSPLKRRYGGEMTRQRSERSSGGSTSILPDITYVKQEEETDPERQELAEKIKPNAKGYYALCYPKERMGKVCVKSPIVI